MIKIADSTLEDYCHSFWFRENLKDNENGKLAWEAIKNGASALQLLQRPNGGPHGGHSYKLPKDKNSVVSIARMEVEDVESLRIHDYMLSDTEESGRWIRERVQICPPKSSRLRDLAVIFLQQGYFSRPSSDVQFGNYKEWCSRGNLRNVMAGHERPLIESIGNGQFEIVDGWGRLLPFVALLEKLPFEPVECYVATE